VQLFIYIPGREYQNRDRQNDSSVSQHTMVKEEWESNCIDITVQKKRKSKAKESLVHSNFEI
jgi:capsular polysaccharide biosynthesis protein